MFVCFKVVIDPGSTAAERRCIYEKAWHCGFRRTNKRKDEPHRHFSPRQHWYRKISQRPEEFGKVLSESPIVVSWEMVQEKA